jgi:endonuclease VIII
MPEGDTVFKLARYLLPELAGERVAHGQARLIPSRQAVTLDGRVISTVYARGKHLFIAFDDGWTLRSHLGMRGSWHGYAPGEPWRRPRRRADVVVDIGRRLFACFNPLQVEWLREGGVRHRRLDVVLGPDLLAEPLDPVVMVQRLRQLADGGAPVVDVLLDQRIACGIGNVYKSEVLFLHGVYPRTPVRDCDDDLFAALYLEAARLLARNTRGGPRVTRWSNDDAGRLWVYGRTGRPCHRCDTGVVSAALGRGLRSTFWCPVCQPAARRVSDPAPAVVGGGRS